MRMTLFPGIAEQVELSPQLVDNYEKRLSLYIQDYYKLAHVFCTELFTTEVDAYEGEWRSDADNIFSNADVYCDVVVETKYETIKSDSLKEFVKRSHDLILPRKYTEESSPCEQQYSSLQIACSPQKAIQVERFCHFLEEEFRLKECCILDIGVGKGYLACHLALDHGINVIGVEASLLHCKGMAHRMRLLQKRMLNLPEYVGRSSFFRMTIGQVTKKTNQHSLEQKSIDWNEFLQMADVVSNKEEHKLGSEIQGACAEEIEPTLTRSETGASQCLALGLHACGDLSEIVLEIQDVLPAVIPCCYPHITAEHFPVSKLGHTILEDFKQLCELSDGNSGIPIPRRFFSYACVDFDEKLDKMVTTVEDFYQRAVIERFRHLRNETDKVCIKRTTPELFEELERMGFSAAKIAEFTPSYEEHVWRIKINIIVRQIFGQVFESFILTDRMLEREGLAIEEVLGRASGRGFCVYEK